MLPIINSTADMVNELINYTRGSIGCVEQFTAMQSTTLLYMNQWTDLYNSFVILINSIVRDGETAVNGEI